MSEAIKQAITTEDPAGAAPATGTEAATAATNGAAGDQNGEENQETQDGDRRFTQAELDRIVKERLQRQQSKADAEAQRAAEAAEEKRLQDAEEFKELAETRQAKLQTVQTELETAQTQLTETQERLEAAETALQTYITKLEEGVPAAVLALMENQPAADRLTWLVENRGSFVANGDGGGDPPSLPETPRPGDKTLTAAERSQRAHKVSL